MESAASAESPERPDEFRCRVESVVRGLSGGVLLCFGVGVWGLLFVVLPVPVVAWPPSVLACGVGVGVGLAA